MPCPCVRCLAVCVQPEFFQLEDGHSGLLLPIRKKTRRSRSGEDEAQSLKAASGTEAKVLAGAISAFAREGRRMVVTAIGAASINQAVKSIAIARKNIEEVRVPPMPSLVHEDSTQMCPDHTCVVWSGPSLYTGSDRPHLQTGVH